MLQSVWHLIVPPMEQRSAHTLLTFAKVFGGGALLKWLAIRIRIRHPAFPLVARIALLAITFVFCLHTTLSHYVFFASQSTEKGLQALSTALDVGMGAACVGNICIAADALLLGTDKDFDVQGADTYRKWQADQNPKMTVAELAQLEKRLTGGRTYERPRQFPGLNASLEQDINATQRGFGYAFAAPKPKVTHNVEAGYEALIASEKLAREPDQRRAKDLKRDAIVRAVAAWFGYVTCIACVTVILLSNKLLYDKDAKVDKMHYILSFTDSTKHSPLGGRWAAFAVIPLNGVMVIAAIQTTYLSFYIPALLLTWPAHKVPITISRWEPYLFYKPYTATSMKAMWRTHWHTMPRRVLVVTCFRPATRLGALLGMPKSVATSLGVLLSFALSGIIHELAMEVVFSRLYREGASYAQQRVRADEATMRKVGYGFGARSYGTTRSFVYFGVVIVVEHIWHGVESGVAGWCGLKSGKLLQNQRLRNVFGWTWTMATMVLSSMPFIEVWYMHGAFSSM